MTTMPEHSPPLGNAGRGIRATEVGREYQVAPLGPTDWYRDYPQRFTDATTRPVGARDCCPAFTDFAGSIVWLGMGSADRPLYRDSSVTGPGRKN